MGWSSIPRWQKFVGALALLVGAYAAFGYLGVPRILKSKGPALVEESFGRTAELGDVSFDPFLFRLDVHDAHVFDQRGGDFAGFSRFTIDFDPVRSLIEFEYHFKEARLVDPLIDVELLESGELDIADLTAADENAGAEPEPEPTEAELAEESAALPPIEFELISIEGGRFVYTDHSREPAFERRIGPIEIAITNFGTRPGEESPYAFKAATAHGATIAWAGQIGIDPFHSAGEISIDNIPLPWSWEFIEDRAHFEVRKGTLALAAKYELSTVDGETDYEIADGRAEVLGLVITPRGAEEPFIAVPMLALEGIAADVGERTISLDALRSQGARLTGNLSQDGEFSWLSHLALDPEENDAPEVPAQVPVEREEGAAEDEAEAEPFTVTLATLQLEDWGFAFEDQSTSPAVAFSLEPISLDVRDISLDLAKPLPVQLQAGLDEGALRIAGNVTPDPLELDLEIGMDAIDLTTFAPYLADLGQFELRRATAGAAGQLQLQMTDAAPIVRYAGTLTIDRLAAADRSKRRDFVRFDALALRGIDVTSEPLDVTVGEVELQRPFVRVSLDESGNLNLAEIFGGESEAPKNVKAVAAREQEAAASGDPIRVDRIRLVNGAFDFIDQSLTPNYETSLDEFTGTIEGLSSDPSTRAKVELTGKLNKYAPIEVAGEINPLAAEGYTDLGVSLRNLELSSFTPYSGKYAGYQIAKGKFTMDLNYKLESRTVEGENTLFLDQLDFGDKVDSEDATNLPVPLAVAILKDKRGEIHIDLPVRGNLDDPEFNYGRMLARTLFNLVTKAATSPFGMLGSLVGLNADEMDYVAFAAGEAILDPTERSKLAAIATALAERPALHLEVRGTATAADLPGLRIAAVEHELKLLRWDKLSEKVRKTMAGPGAVVLAPEDRDDLLEKLYAMRFDESYRAVRNRLREERKAQGLPNPEDERGPVHETMHLRLLQSQEVGTAELRVLAKARAAIVKDELVVSNTVEDERVFIVEVDATAAGRFEEGSEEGDVAEAAAEIAETAADVSVRSPLTLSSG